jgi:hypothetical protein
MTHFVPTSYVMVFGRGGWVVYGRNDGMPRLHANIMRTGRHSFQRALAAFRINYPNGVTDPVKGYSGGDARPLVWDAAEGAGLVRFTSAQFLANIVIMPHAVGGAIIQRHAATLVRVARAEVAPKVEAAPRAKPVREVPCGHHARGLDCPQHGAVDPKKRAAQMAAEREERVAVRKLREPCAPPAGATIPLPAFADIVSMVKDESYANRRNTTYLTYLGSGVHRVTYRINGTDFVAKFGNGPSGRRANLNEAASYSKLPEEVRHLFCPLYALASDGSVSVMPYLQNVCGATPQMKAALTAAHVGCRDIDGHNVAEMADGQKVIFDYGFGITLRGEVVGHDGGD